MKVKDPNLNIDKNDKKKSDKLLLTKISIWWSFLSDEHVANVYKKRIRFNNDPNSLSRNSSHHNTSAWINSLFRKKTNKTCPYYFLPFKWGVHLVFSDQLSSRSLALLYVEKVTNAWKKWMFQWQFHLKPTIFGETKFVYKRPVTSIESSHCRTNFWVLQDRTNGSTAVNIWNQHTSIWKFNWIR